MPETLLMGSIGDPTVPTAGAKLWQLSVTSYGQQVASTGGSDSLLYLETDDIPLGGEAATVILRRLYIKEFHEGQAVYQVTPVADFSLVGTPQSYTRSQGAVRLWSDLNVYAAQYLTHLRAIVQVLSRTGRCGITQATAAVVPRAPAADVVARGS